ncbi:MAG: lipopolysaccharide assembly protein LapA domain-containing protein [Endomicrobiales bacterium]|nr:lipopolysaccharide assembly protein LapA domain-containing protein [Endomicrobiales bacterium]
MKYTFIFVFILCAAMLVFSMQNTATVYITFLKWGTFTTLTISVLAAFTGGVITGMLMLLPQIIRKNSKIKTLKTKLTQTDPSKSEIYVNK